MSVADDLRDRADRVEALEEAKEAIENILYAIESLDLPDGIQGSHHAEMEFQATLEQIEQAIEEES